MGFDYGKLEKGLTVAAIIACAAAVISTAAYFITKPKEVSTLYGTYAWEGDGFGGDFTVTVGEDGVMSVHEGSFTVSDVTGSWELKDNHLYFSSQSGMKQHFRTEKDALVFTADGSDNFHFRQVADGDKFIKQKG